MKDKKIIFNFDVKGSEALLRVLADTQKEFNTLNDSVKKVSDNLNKDLSNALKSFEKFTEVNKIFSEIKKGLSDVDKESVDVAAKMAQSFISGKFTETMKKMRDNITQLKTEITTLASEIKTLEASGKTDEAKQKLKEFMAKTTTLEEAQKTYQRTQEYLYEQITSGDIQNQERFADRIGNAVWNAISRGIGGDGRTARRGELDGDEGAIRQLRSILDAIPGPLGSIIRAGSGILQRYGPIGTALYAGYQAVQHFTGVQPLVQDMAAARTHEAIAAEEALTGDITRQILRRRGADIGTQVLTQPMRHPLDALRAMGFALLAPFTTRFGTTESIENYVLRRLREGTEDVDVETFRRFGFGAGTNILMRDLSSNLNLSRMYGDEAVRAGINVGRTLGFTEEETRPVRHAIAMYQQRMIGNEDTYLIKAARTYGFSVPVQEEIARTYTKTTAAGVLDALQLISTAGLTRLEDRFGAQALLDFIAQQKTRMGAEFTISDIGGGIAAAVPFVREEANKALQAAGRDTRVSSLEVVRKAAEVGMGYSETLAAPGTIFNSVLMAQLMGMGVSPRESAVLAQMPLHSSVDLRARLAKYLSQLPANQRAGRTYTEEDVRNVLAAGQQQIGELAERISGITPEFAQTFGVDPMGYMLTRELDITKQKAARAAVTWQGAEAQVGVETVPLRPMPMPEEAKETLIDAQTMANAHKEAIATTLTPKMNELITAIKESSKEIVDVMTEQNEELRRRSPKSFLLER